MQIVKWAVRIAVVMVMLGAGTAWACVVTGKVVCGGTDSGVAGAMVTLSYAGTSGWTTYSGSTDADGNFGITVPAALTLADVEVDYGTGSAIFTNVSIDTSQGTFAIGSFSVALDTCGTTPQCDLSGLRPGVYCYDRPLRTMAAECRILGLPPLEKVDGQLGSSFPATISAAAAVVKAGSTDGQFCYNVYVGVNRGDILSSASGQNVSHVTYCDCPPE